MDSRVRSSFSAGLFAPIVAASLALMAAPSSAQCPNVTEQTFTGGGTVACPCFVSGEEIAGVFTNIPAADYPIEVLKIQIGWGSVFGGNPDTLEDSLHIYSTGLPNPGVPQFSVSGPVLIDGAINEFDLALFPGNKVLNSGPFTVSLRLLNNSVLSSPSPVHDGNGCTSGVSLIKAVPGGWLNACSAGVTGDWVVGVVYKSLGCNNSFSTSTSTISLGAGGQQIMTLDAGAANAGKFYWIFGSATGTSPGLDFGGGIVLPLNFDAYFNFTLTKPFAGIYNSFVGQLNILGGGLAALTLPPGVDPSLAGLTLDHAYLASTTLGGTVEFASNPISVMLTL